MAQQIEEDTDPRQVEMRAIHSLLSSAANRLQALTVSGQSSRELTVAEERVVEALNWVKLDGHKGRWAE